MPNSNAQVLKDFILSNELLDDDKKKQFLTVIDGLGQMKVGADDAVALEELGVFIDNFVLDMEREAIAARDTERIKELTNLRNARIEFEKQLLGLDDDI